jgi:protein-L-isoaspartate(D-aspartate) O-methyltransferase
MEKVVQDQLDRLVGELRQRGCLRTPSVAAAFATVPRHHFLPPQSRGRAYAVDEAIPTHFDHDGVPISSSSAPTIMAAMLEMLEAESGERVLEIGAGTGYNAALLAQLVGPRGRVVSIDVNPTVAAEADSNVTAFASNVHVVTGDGWDGAVGEQFDRVIVTAESWDISPHWVEQLRDGGVLVLPLWLRPGLTFAVGFQKVNPGLESRSLAFCGFMPLQGSHGGPPRRATVRAWPDPSGESPETRMIVVLDDASPERVSTLERLLREPPSITSAPHLRPGWNVRLALGQADSIAFAGLSAKSRLAMGLFEASEDGLAVVEGEHVVSFGDPRCRERLVTALMEATPIQTGNLRITAIPHQARPGPSRPLMRPSFDLVVEEVAPEEVAPEEVAPEEDR